jgi:predicted Zn-ribbon and HTH transcriptional regulator
MFKNQKEINVACPRCKSENIFIGRILDIKPNDTLKCNDCSYNQLAHRFKDQWRIQNSKRINTIN